jgi:glycosyltransferase involved in cell wall biosynthesis
MLNDKTIAVIGPAYNEENQIGHVIETMTEFVDRIVVVNDNSTDATAEIVKQYMEQDGQETVALPSVLNDIQQKTKYNRGDPEMLKADIKCFMKNFNKLPEPTFI